MRTSSQPNALARLRSQAGAGASPPPRRPARHRSRRDLQPASAGWRRHRLRPGRLLVRSGRRRHGRFADPPGDGDLPPSRPRSACADIYGPDRLGWSLGASLCQLGRLFTRRGDQRRPELRTHRTPRTIELEELGLSFDGTEPLTTSSLRASRRKGRPRLRVQLICTADNVKHRSSRPMWCSGESTSQGRVPEESPCRRRRLRPLPDRHHRIRARTTPRTRARRRTTAGR